MKSIIVALTVLFLGVACLSINAQSDPGGGFIENYEAGYKHVIDRIDQFKNFTSKSSFLQKVSSDFAISDQVQIYSLQELVSNPGLLSVSKDLRRLLETLNSGINQSSSYNEFLAALSGFERGASKLTDSAEKQNALSFASLFRQTMEVTRTQLQFYHKYSNTFEEDLVAWWGIWGKCATNVVGGAIAGAVAGAAAGGSLGTSIPGIGTATGAIVGAVAGAIGGALTSAAASCGSN